MTDHSASNIDLTPLLNRLDRLERQNRWLKGLGLALLLIVGAGVLMGAAEPASDKTISTEKLVLRDGNGKPRIMLATDKDQNGIVFYDANGRQNCTFVLQRDGAVLRFLEEDGRLSSGISCERGGIGLVGIGTSGRRQTEVNAIIVPGQVLLNARPFTVGPNPPADK
jgi:hypothetical protein